MNDRKIRVYFIDDHPLIIEGLKADFANNRTNLILAGSSNKLKTAILEIVNLNPDIILLDLFLGKEDPVCNLRCLKRIFPTVPIVVYSAEVRVFWKLRMLESGAHAYITKAEHPTVVEETLVDVFHGKYIFTEDVMKIMNGKKHTIGDHCLTIRDQEIMNLLSAGFNINEIGINLGINRHVVDKCLYCIRKRLGFRSNEELIHKLTMAGENGF